MNREQKIVLWIAGVLAGLAVIFPPVGVSEVETWVDKSEGLVGETVMGMTVGVDVGFIGSDWRSVRYDILCLELCAAGIAGGVLLYVVRDRKPRAPA